MTQLINFDTEHTMSSLDFLDNIINPARKEFGESSHTNSKFLLKLEDELGDLPVGKIFQPTRGGTPQRYYDLNMKQMLLVGMRESKAVRRSILDTLEALSTKLTELKLKEEAHSAMLAALYVSDVAQEVETLRRKFFRAEADNGQLLQRYQDALFVIDKFKNKIKDDELRKLVGDMTISWNYSAENRVECIDAHSRAELSDQRHGALIYGLQKSAAQLGVEIEALRVECNNPIQLLLSGSTKS